MVMLGHGQILAIRFILNRIFKILIQNGLKLSAERTLAVFDLTEREKRMVKSGLVFRIGNTCK